MNYIIIIIIIIIITKKQKKINNDCAHLHSPNTHTRTLLAWPIIVYLSYS